MNRVSQIIGGASFLLAGGLALGVAVVAATVVERRSIEAVETQMTIAGLDWVAVDADGLQVFLQGTAPDEAENFRAFSLAGTIVDADRVVNMMTVAENAPIAPPRFSVDMLRNGDGIQLIGLVPAASGAEAVTEAIARIAEGVEVTDMIETADFPVPGTWEAALQYGLRALQELPRSKVTVFEDRVEVQAISGSVAERAGYIAALERGQPRNVDIVLDISAPRPVITPFTLRFVIDDDGPRFETCAADTLEARDKIIAAAQAAGAPGLLTCQIGLGAPSPQWADAAEYAIAALDELGSGSVTIRDADITLVAIQGTEQDRFDRVVGELGAMLPDLFSLSGVLPDPPETEEAGPARFLADLTEDGAITLRGRVPEDAVGQSVSAFATALFGLAQTDVATRAVPDLPEGWAVRTMVGLEALSLLVEGTLVVEPDRIVLAGRTGSTETRSNISRLLTEELGGGEGFELNIAYDEELDPVASLPSPEECVARIQAVQDDAKIVFEPGSVEITEAAGEILDSIAAILPDCRHVRMEIGGHTDSQGREQMNLNLSQARADSVLNGFLARNVLVSNLTAQGYGESQPIASNETEEGREANRRIEFRLLSEAVTEAAALDAEEAAAARAAQLAVWAEIRPQMRPDSVVEAAQAAADEEDSE